MASPLPRCGRYRQNRPELVVYSPLPGQEEAAQTVLEQVEVTSTGRAK